MRIIQAVFLLLIFGSILSAQTERTKWNVTNSSQVIHSNGNPSQILKEQNGILNSIRDVYKFLISDLDGDNCPFEPTCSVFFVDAVKQTNLLEGTLMFADRFTRDLNLLKIENQYPIAPNGKFYDPVQKYSLQSFHIIK